MQEKITSAQLQLIRQAIEKELNKRTVVAEIMSIQKWQPLAIKRIVRQLNLAMENGNNHLICGAIDEVLHEFSKIQSIAKIQDLQDIIANLCDKINKAVNCYKKDGMLIEARACVMFVSYLLNSELKLRELKEKAYVNNA